MTKKEVVKGVSEFCVEFADNGYIITFSGEDQHGDWANSKRLVLDTNQLIQAINTIDKLR